jgi:hypothetical protein
MNCLNRVEVQEYIDNEISSDRRAEIEQHLSLCSSCRELYGRALSDKDLINGLLHGLENEIPVPSKDFSYPERGRKKHNSLYIIMVMAAASVITFILLFRQRSDVVEEIHDEEKLVQDFYDGKDLNKMWHDNSQILILKDDDGNIQSVLTN